MTALLLAGGQAGPSGHRLALALLPLLLVAVGLDIYCIADLVRAPSVRYLPKAIWAVIIILVSCPAGALLYLFLGRDRDRGSKVAG